MLIRSSPNPPRPSTILHLIDLVLSYSARQPAAHPEPNGLAIGPSLRQHTPTGRVDSWKGKRWHVRLVRERRCKDDGLDGSGRRGQTNPDQPASSSTPFPRRAAPHRVATKAPCKPCKPGRQLGTHSPACWEDPMPEQQGPSGPRALELGGPAKQPRARNPGIPRYCLGSPPAFGIHAFPSLKNAALLASSRCLLPRPPHGHRRRDCVRDRVRDRAKSVLFVMCHGSHDNAPAGPRLPLAAL